MLNPNRCSSDQTELRSKFVSASGMHSQQVNLTRIRSSLWRGSSSIRCFSRPRSSTASRFWELHQTFRLDNCRLYRPVVFQPAPLLQVYAVGSPAGALKTSCRVLSKQFKRMSTFRSSIKRLVKPSCEQHGSGQASRSTQTALCALVARLEKVCRHYIKFLDFEYLIYSDACTGDGGAPLMCHVAGRWYAVGLVAWGIGE